MFSGKLTRSFTFFVVGTQFISTLLLASFLPIPDAPDTNALHDTALVNWEPQDISEPGGEA